MTETRVPKNDRKMEIICWHPLQPNTHCRQKHGWRQELDDYGDDDDQN